jgi:hypothetical protein
MDGYPDIVFTVTNGTTTLTQILLNGADEDGQRMLEGGSQYD